ncbi:SDR family NAD(P)-dependent oxidoreductase [Methylobacterium sp. WSM2598]|uniref:SDR family NAD(P)-dependent oxidoreductase n=1 Tax=Methylobacterium sp. WSM2598 TaxID=398261 RepID=UPI000372DFEF|nr:SDR family NAD(P)-dependent oxidoreductase [Methylobacterium sp. WSM2598]
MPDIPYASALIVGAGAGISASLARKLAGAGLRVALAARSTDKLAALAAETGALTVAADAADPDAIRRLFETVDAQLGAPEVVIYNASGRLRGSLADVDPEGVRKAVEVTAFGAFLTVQQAARRMLPGSRGAILLTGATAGLKGYAGSAAFAMGKFALRGLAQSAARELGPKGIHVAHVVVDGGVRSAARPDPAERPDSTLSPDGVAQAYLDLLRQPGDAWTFELDLRPWVETF